MKTIFYCISAPILVSLISLFVVPCGEHLTLSASETESELHRGAISIRNTHFNWWVVEEGERFGASPILFAESIVIKNLKDQAYLFTPADPVSVYQSSFSVKAPWSPDGQTLVLPNGRFNGFVVCPGTGEEVLEAMRASYEFHVHMKNETELFHDFVAWHDEKSFIFTVGLSGDYEELLYDIENKSIHYPDRKKQEELGKFYELKKKESSSRFSVKIDD